MPAWTLAGRNSRRRGRAGGTDESPIGYQTRSRHDRLASMTFLDKAITAPVKADLDRNLSGIAHKARRDAEAERARLRGAGLRPL